MDANVVAMARDLQKILRIGTEQKRLWEAYDGEIKFMIELVFDL